MLEIFKKAFVLTRLEFYFNVRFYEQMNRVIDKLYLDDPNDEVFIRCIENIQQETKKSVVCLMFINLNTDYFDRVSYNTIVILVVSFIISMIFQTFFIPIVATSLYLIICILLNIIITYNELVKRKRRLLELYIELKSKYI